MYTLGLPVPAVAGREGDRDGATIRDYVEETAREFGIDQQHPLRPPGDRAPLVVRRGALDGRDRQAARASPAPSCSSAAAITITPRLSARLAGRGRLQGRIVHPQFWPEDLDCRRQEGRRDRQRRDRGHPRSLARRTAAHVTMVQRSPTYIVARPARRPDRRRLQRLLPRRPPARRPLEERLLDIFLFTRDPQEAGKARAMLIEGCPQAAPRRLPHRAAFLARPTMSGTSASAWCPTATCSRRSARARSRRHRRIERFTPDRAQARHGERDRSRRDRHRHRPRREAVRRHRSSASTASRSTSSDRFIWKGMMLSDVPNSFCRSATPTRPGPCTQRRYRQVRLPPAQPHEGGRL